MGSGPNAAAAAAAAGFSGEALRTIVAIGFRESGWEPEAQGDVAIQTPVWGPSCGVWQIRTYKSETGTGGDRDIHALIPGATPGVSGTGRGDLARQAAAAYAISAQGSNFLPWSTFKGLSSEALAQADAALAGMGSASSSRSSSSSGGTPAQTTDIAGDVLSTLADAMDQALGAFVGAPDGETFSEWLLEHVIRTLEVIGGALILGAGLMVLLNVLGTPAGALPGESVAARGGRAAKRATADAMIALASL